jgi:hypothetical protein
MLTAGGIGDAASFASENNKGGPPTPKRSAHYYLCYPIDQPAKRVIKTENADLVPTPAVILTPQ